MRALLLLASLLSLPARADILFFDLNFSPNEVTAATAAAKSRGEALLLFPRRTPEQHRNIEKYYRLQDSLAKKLGKCRPGPECEKIQKELEEVDKSLGLWIAQLKQVKGEEVQRIFEELDRDGKRLSTVIFSGHSGGTGFLSGMLGFIDVQQVKAGFDRFPRLLDGVDSMLLWGCYSGTLHSLHTVWRKVFPSVSTWGGFENRSPLGIRESSGRFLKSFLLGEARLRSARNLREAHRAFRSMDLVAELDGTAVVRDWYFTYDQADLVEAMLKRCEEFDPKLSEAFTCYNNGQPGCENPPANHRGVLRDLYSFLQVNRHCRQELAQKFQIPSLEYLVRLIYLDNIKKNFAVHHAPDQAPFRALLQKVGFPQELGLENFVASTRAEDVARFKWFGHVFGINGYRDYSVVDRPDARRIYQLAVAKENLNNLIGPSYYAMIDDSCVPFSWVEPKSSEKDKCELSESVREPLSKSVEESIYSSGVSARYFRYLDDRILANPWNVKDEGGEKLKAATLEYLRTTISWLEKLSDPSDLEKARLVLAGQQLAEAEGASEVAIAAGLFSRYTEHQELVKEELRLAAESRYGQNAVYFLNAQKEHGTLALERLRKIVNGQRPL